MVFFLESRRRKWCLVADDARAGKVCMDIAMQGETERHVPSMAKKKWILKGLDETQSRISIPSGLLNKG